MSRIYKGNQSEPKTLQDILSELYNDYDNLIDKLIIPSIVMDKGIATAENIAYLRENSYSYFVIEHRDALKDYGEHFSDMGDFEEYRVTQNNRIYLKKLVEADVVRVLVYSTGKEEKEKGMMGEKEERFLEEVKKLISSNQKGYIKDADKIMLRIGRFTEKHSPISFKYKLLISRDKKPS